MVSCQSREKNTWPYFLSPFTSVYNGVGTPFFLRLYYELKNQKEMYLSKLA